MAPAYVERVSAFICFLCIQINFAPALLLGLGLQTIFSMLKGAINSIVISSLISSLVSNMFCLRCGLRNVLTFVANLMIPFGNITVCFDDLRIRTFGTISELLLIMHP